MEYKIKGYQPEAFFHFFEEISAIPRPSGKEQAICRYLISFARQRNLPCYTDELYNVIIRKPASIGAEHLPAVMLQGHTDMVCEKNADVEHDFDTQGIDLVVENGFVKANGTTLGGDNGVAVALMLALLDDTTLVHPPLECVFTTQEETGLFGAANLDCQNITAKTMINLDAEQEGIATVSCAGGVRVQWKHNCHWEDASGRCALHIFISGLLGGHSGADIHLERTNANKLMGRFLYPLLNIDGMRLVGIHGGNKDNAIPRECTAVVSFANPGEYDEAIKLLESLIYQVQAEIWSTEPDFRVEIMEQTTPQMLSRTDTEQIIKAIYLAPNGAQRRNIKQNNFVVSSLNMGVIQTNSEVLEIHLSPRSSVNSLQQETKQILKLLGETFCFEVAFHSEYPGWSFVEHSPIREVFCECYYKLFHEDLKIEALHAGLECGLFIGKIPDLDAIAVGPSGYDCHTPDERVDLASCERFWKLLLAVLEQMTKS